MTNQELLSAMQASGRLHIVHIGDPAPKTLKLFVDYRHTNDRSAIRSYPSFTKVIEEQTELSNQIVAELVADENENEVFRTTLEGF